MLASIFGGIMHNLGDGVAQALANSRSMQGVVRVLNLYGGHFGGNCELRFVRHGDSGVEVNLGSSNTQIDEHKFSEWLVKTDELMLLEAMISSLRDRHADSKLISDLIDEANALVLSLYPNVKVEHES